MQSTLIVDFVNSLDLQPYREGLGTPGELAAWLVDHGLAEEGLRVTNAEHAEALRVREAIRDLLGAHNEVETDVDAATAELDEAARRARLGLRFTAEGVRLEPQAAGARAAVGRLLAEISVGMADGTWQRLKACRADDCRWAFLDTAKNRSRAWCSMSSCGNREKVRAYRERHSS